MFATNDWVYICGKISDWPGYSEEFRKAETVLLSLGWSVSKIINPVRECDRLRLARWSSECTARCMDIFPRTGTLCRIPTWKDFSSVAAKIENALAFQRGLVVCDLVGDTLKIADEWLEKMR